MRFIIFRAHVVTARRISHNWTHSAKVKVMLRPTVNRSVCFGVKHPFGAYDQICITVRQLRVCWCGALSLARDRVCRLQLLFQNVHEQLIKKNLFDVILISQHSGLMFGNSLKRLQESWTRCCYRGSVKCNSGSQPRSCVFCRNNECYCHSYKISGCFSHSLSTCMKHCFSFLP
jgi:hypothetical protein